MRQIYERNVKDREDDSRDTRQTNKTCRVSGRLTQRCQAPIREV